MKEEIKINFRTPVSPRKIVYSKHGEKEEIELALEINKETGEESFYIKGKTNVYEKIQAHASECDLGVILERCKNTNDYSALNQVQHEYGDISEMPKSYIEAYAKIGKLQDEFYNLPLKIRAEYDNSFNKFLANVGTEKWMKNLGYIVEPKEEPKEEPKQEEKTNEQGE